MGFFEQFFEQRGEFIVKPNNEVNVLCPFPHDKGYETRPSAHVNVEKRVFHCKTCFAEGRLETGGLSEVGFIAKLYNIPYAQAVELMRKIDKADDIDEDTWHECMNRLEENEEAMQYLIEKRGLTKETIKKYRLGYNGAGIVYPVFIHGILADKRTYNMNPQEGEPKIKSEPGSSPLLFPFDDWYNDPADYTLLCAGENDTLLARQAGFNALTVTGGEGSFPTVFLGLFKDRTVYICYDCDEAGRQGARRVAFLLKEAGANVFIVDLGLSGDKDDKDVTDFFLKHNRKPEDLYKKIEKAKPYTTEDYIEAKNEYYPLVDLWEVGFGKYEGKRISSRVVMAGRYDMTMRVPTAVEWHCDNPVIPGEGNRSPCNGCPLQLTGGGSLWWTLTDQNMRDILYLVEQNEKNQDKAIMDIFGIPHKCPNGEKRVKAKEQVYKVIFTPDVESESVDEFKACEQFAYLLGNQLLEDGYRYRIYFRSYAHPLQGGRVYAVVDRVEESDNAISTFQMTPELKDQLKVFQGNPFDTMFDRAKRMVKINGDPYLELDPMIAYAVDLVYHSPLQFNYKGILIDKGFPEILVIGETRTGKSSTAIKFQKYVGIGNRTVLKEASRASLLGGSETLPSGGHRIRWGTIPKNHRGLVILDEMSGMSTDVMAALTDMRSSGYATLEKFGNGGSRAPALTRLLWLSNPRTQFNGRSRPLNQYAFGIDVVRELIGADEDIARFDAIMTIGNKESDKNKTVITTNDALEPYPREVYRNLIYWVWSRKPHQILWEMGVEDYVKQVADELNESYDCDVKLLGVEAWKKLARIAVSCAACCFSCSEDGENIVVKKEHVDWAADFLKRCYDNPIFKLKKYSEVQRVYNETNEQVNNIVIKLIHTNSMIIKLILESPEGQCSYKQLELASGLDRDEFKNYMNLLVSNYLVRANTVGISPTPRLQKAVEFYRENHEKTRMVPLSQQGGSPV